MMKKIWGLIALLSLLALGGCDDVKETISQMRAELKQDILNEESQSVPANEEMVEPTQELQVPKAEDITIEETYQTVQTVAKSNGEETTVLLYFADNDGQSLVKQEKKIPKVEGIARATIEALLVGPDANSGLLSAIPAGTELLDINVKPDEKLCIIDLSREFADAAQNGEGQDLAVYAIANTLCQFATVDKVEFRIEGENVASLGGKVNLSQTVKADYSLVK